MATKAYGESTTERAVEQADDAPISTAVVEAIADVEAVESTELEFALYDVVDLDALEDLCASGDEELVLEFTVEDYRVRVRGDRAVFVESL